MADRPDNPRLPEEVVDAFFDRSLEEGSRERFYATLRRDLRQCEQVARTQRALSMLRGPVDCPDLTDQIMTRVAGRRAFLSPRLRSLVTGGRLAVAASLLLGLLGVAVIQRYAPRTVQLTTAPQPVSRIVEGGCESAAQSARQLAGTLSTVRAEAAPLARLGDLAIRGLDTPQRAAHASLTPGVLTSVRVLSADSPETGLRVAGGAEATASFRADRFLLTCSPTGTLPRPGTSQWVWAAGPGHSLEDSLSALPAMKDPSSNPLWPAVDPLLIEIAKPKSPKH
jgi:hypothetical protein